MYRGTCVGVHRHDLVVRGGVVEVKTQKTNEFKESAYLPQIMRYAAHAKKSECIILVVFTPTGVVTRLYP
jgi:hypothetical protein